MCRDLSACFTDPALPPPEFRVPHWRRVREHADTAMILLVKCPRCDAATRVDVHTREEVQCRGGGCGYTLCYPHAEAGGRCRLRVGVSFRVQHY